MASVNNDNTTATLEALGLYRPPSQNKDTKADNMGATQFMELMLAQMKHQDPLKPMENGEFIAQLAQFSTVTGVQEMQKSLSALSTSLQSSQALQASTLIGRSVVVPSTAGVLDAEAGMEGEIGLPSSTQRLTVGIYNDAGQLVRKLELGTQSAGIVPFSWDGLNDQGETMPPGTYAFKAEATLDGEATALDTWVRATVESVDLGMAGGVQLNLAGLGSISFNDVQQIM